MKSFQYRSISALSLFLACFMLLAQVPSSHAQQATQTVVVHLSHYSDDLHAASMALKIGKMLSDEGAAVTLFADLEGVRLGDSRVPQGLSWGQGKSVAELYSAFVDAGGEVALCPHCAEAAGITAAMLRDGSRIVSEEETASLFLAADKIVDY